MDVNASEPLTKCRKRKEDVKTEGFRLLRDWFGGHLLTVRTASGIKVARTRSGLLCGTWEPVAPMPRENRKWRPHERESTDAEHRDGPLRSSDEGVNGGATRDLSRAARCIDSAYGMLALEGWVMGMSKEKTRYPLGKAYRVFGCGCRA